MSETAWQDAARIVRDLQDAMRRAEEDHKGALALRDLRNASLVQDVAARDALLREGADLMSRHSTTGDQALTLDTMAWMLAVRELIGEKP